MKTKTRMLVFKNNKIFVLEKKGIKKRFTLAGGVTKKKETKKEGLIRETAEEIGVQLNKSNLHHFTSFLIKKGKGLYVKKHYYIAKSSVIKEYKNLEPEKFETIGWKSIQKVLPYLDKTDTKAVIKYLKIMNHVLIKTTNELIN